MAQVYKFPDKNGNIVAILKDGVYHKVVDTKTYFVQVTKKRGDLGIWLGAGYVEKLISLGCHTLHIKDNKKGWTYSMSVADFKEKAKVVEKKAIVSVAEWKILLKSGKEKKKLEPRAKGKLLLKPKIRKIVEHPTIRCALCDLNFKELAPPGPYCTECRKRKAVESHESYNKWKLERGLPIETRAEEEARCIREIEEDKAYRLIQKTHGTNEIRPLANAPVAKSGGE